MLSKSQHKREQLFSTARNSDRSDVFLQLIDSNRTKHEPDFQRSKATTKSDLEVLKMSRYMDSNEIPFRALAEKEICSKDLLDSLWRCFGAYASETKG